MAPGRPRICERRTGQLPSDEDAGRRGPFRWLANGKPLPGAERRRNLSWQPDGQGFSTLTVIDAKGRSARVSVFIE